MQCPICKKEVDQTTIGTLGGHFPFCSDRCKLIDLGRWLKGAYQIPIETEDESEPDAMGESSAPTKRGGQTRRLSDR